MDIFSRVKDTVTSATAEAGDKVSYNTEKVKINNQIRANEKEVEKIIYQVGVKCVELHLMDENSEYEELFSQIRNYHAKNKEFEMEIVRLGEEYNEKTRVRQQELQEKQEQYKQRRQEQEAANMTETTAADEHSIVCPSCGTVNDEDAKFCVGCGSRIEHIQEV